MAKIIIKYYRILTKYTKEDKVNMDRIGKFGCLLVLSLIGGGGVTY